MHTCMPGLAVQNYATYPSMPGALRALCPDFRGVITGIRPYARYHFIDTTIACPIDVGSCHYLRNGLADVGRVTGEVIRYGQPEPMRL